MTERRALAGLLFAAFLARMAYCFFLSPYGLHDAVLDISCYDQLARSLLAAGSLIVDGAVSSVREPGYPFFLAAVYGLFGANYAAVWTVQSLIGAAAVAGVFVLGKKVFGRNVAWAAAAFASFYPQFVYYTANAERETLQVAVLVWVLVFLIDAARNPSSGRMAGAGALWALLPLINSALLPAGALTGAGIWLFGRRLKKSKAYFSYAGIFLSAFLALYAVWPLRNFLQFGRFIPGISAGGAHLYVSLIVPNDDAGTPREAEIIAQDPVMQASEGLTEAAKDRYFYGKSAQWIAERPGSFAVIMLESLLKLWRLYPYPRDYGANYRLIKWTALLSDGWLIPLGLIGLLLAGRRFPEGVFFHIVLLAVTGSYMVFWAIIRYRLPMMPLVMLYAAYALERLAGRFKPQLLVFKSSS